MDTTIIKEHIIRRAGGICRDLSKVFPEGDARFHIGGGSLTGRLSDIDLFPDTTAVPTPNTERVAETKNASTYVGVSCPVQVCNYQHDSLQELVDSFDFAHIQVGVTVKQSQGSLWVVDCYFTDAFVQSRALGISWFTGSEYPLASLIRLSKYYKRGDMQKGSQIRCVLSILTAIVKRGFRDYEDFKDQLDAVDLGLLPEEFKEVGDSPLGELFALLNRQELKKDTPGSDEATDNWPDW